MLEAKAAHLGLGDAVCGALSLDAFPQSTFFESSEPFEVILLSESWEPIMGIDAFPMTLYHLIAQHQFRALDRDAFLTVYIMVK